jgi:tRNA A37 methylthiotransferase MiaB
MGRKYSAEDFMKCVGLARSACPEITIATDVIAGFPGETEADFGQTLGVLEKTGPDVVNIARYSKRPGTRAAEMGGQLQEGEKKERSKRLTKFRNGLFLEKNKRLAGKRFRALVSEKKPDGKFLARTSTYRPVIVDSHFGEFVDVRLARASTHFFFGKIE